MKRLPIATGRYSVYPIDTARWRLDGGAMFGVVPKALWSKHCASDPLNRIELAARCMLLVGEGRTILIDTGLGSKFTEKQLGMYSVEQRGNAMDDSMAQCGISREDVTDVVLTHLHFDHAGGSTCVKDGCLATTFPNAVYYVQSRHLAHALNPTVKDRGSFLPNDFEPLLAGGQLEQVDGEVELFKGLRLKVFHGHTFAQQLPFIEDDAGGIFFCCDLFPTTLHLKLPWVAAYDLQPLVTLEEKSTVLKNALHEGWRLFFSHDPRAVCGGIVENHSGVHLSADAVMV